MKKLLFISLFAIINLAVPKMSAKIEIINEIADQEIVLKTSDFGNYYILPALADKYYLEEYGNHTTITHIFPRTTTIKLQKPTLPANNDDHPFTSPMIFYCTLKIGTKKYKPEFCLPLHSIIDKITIQQIGKTFSLILGCKLTPKTQQIKLIDETEFTY